ncbi:MAG: hypothetical protein PVJ77_13320 [Desulfobacterales bacterium]|jgi:hypothetical protein
MNKDQDIVDPEIIKEVIWDYPFPQLIYTSIHGTKEDLPIGTG